MFKRISVLVLLLGTLLSHAEQNYVYSDTWVCNDGLNRVVASSDQGVVRKEIDTTCVMGMFYYVWHGQHGPEIKDITRLLEKNVQQPQWGGVNQFHWGGKPALGYYVGGDPFIVARHMQMLVDAGIDFYFFDVTNGFTYDAQIKVVMNEIDRRQRLGLKTPKLAFMTHSGSNNLVGHYYNNYYSNPKYDKYWFYWDGKPLILSNSDEYASLSNHLKDAFTHRFSWAWDSGEDRWPWLAYYPQKVNFTVDSTGNKIEEQITVSTAQHAYSKIGKSYHSGKEPTLNAYGLPSNSTPYGYYFKEQWQQAISKHPKVVMITQWNEWMAQRFEITSSSQYNLVRPGAKASIGESYFVDVYNQEFSRDIEPSSEALVRDNYYLQMVSSIRKFRGVHNIPVPTISKTISLQGDFTQWDDVTPEFCDEPGDVFYTSSSQSAACLRRPSNDIICAKVTKDADSLYFYVEVTGDSLVQPTSMGEESWMNLLLNTNLKYNDGWEGYDYMVSRVKDAPSMQLYRYDVTTSSWEPVAPVSYCQGSHQLMLSLSKHDVEAFGDCDIDFKWVDNTVWCTPEILHFLRDGEAAPNGRFNYRYKGSLLPSQSSTGITSVPQPSVTISCDYQEARFHIPSGVNVEVFDLSGKFMGVVNSQHAILHLPTGIYVAKYEQGIHQDTIKFTVR